MYILLRYLLALLMFCGPAMGESSDFGRSSFAAKTAGTGGKFTVGAYNDIKGTVSGLDAHHVGQQALMKRLA